MARMIPSVLSPEVKSSGEIRIFEWFRDDPETNGWVVLHSLGIANHATKMYGEIDFFVIAPKLGIFALEVKAGSVSRKDGHWFFTNKYGKTSSKARGPFEQASEGMFSFRAEMEKRYGKNHSFCKVLSGYGVMFPDIEFDVQDIDAEQWQVFDQRDGQNISSFIKRLSKGTKGKWISTYGSFRDEEKLPDSRTVKELTAALRGNFDKAVAFSTQINYAEEALISLTAEQLKCLDQLEDNSRCLIQGPAGTGKTLLAIEEAKKSVAKGELVALLCYNTMLGEWLNSYFDLTDKTLKPAYVGTFHSFMYSIVNGECKRISSISGEKMQAFYREELPLLALDAIELNDVRFDKLVIDEAQDLINEDYLDVMDSVLINGISRGKWGMFGDFEMQAIYNSDTNPDKMKQLLEERTAYVKYKLRTNCRNTKPIGEEIKMLTGFINENYLATKVSGPPVEYIIWNNVNSQITELQKLIEKLNREGIRQSSITILSPSKIENSIVSMAELSEYGITDFKPDGSNKKISFSTIQGFKGLENSIIILVDIETLSYEKLMYVGLSRARTGLFILESEKAEKERRDLLKRWL